MKKCEPWTVAAVYLMQSASGIENYTNIVSYIIETELTPLVEKNVRTSHIVNEILNQKVVNGRAVFNANGNGYYSLNDEEAILNNEDVQDAIRCLKEKNLRVNLNTHKDTEKKRINRDDILNSDDERLSDEARKLSEETLKLSDEARKLSDETLKLSKETIRLSNENKNLRETNSGLREENQQLKEKLQSIMQLCG